MSKFVKLFGALGTITLVFLATIALRGASGRVIPPEPIGIPRTTTFLAIKGVKTEGALGPTTVRKTLTADFARLSACCREAAQNAVPLPRRITLVFQVGPDGRLTGEPLGKPPLADQKFESLMASAFRTLQFPTFKGAPVQVEVTLALAG